MPSHPVPPPTWSCCAYDTPTICNVVELFDLRPRTAGYMDGRIQACYPKLPPMVGYASTATFRSAAPPRSGNVYSGLAEQVAVVRRAAGAGRGRLSGPRQPGRRRRPSAR